MTETDKKLVLNINAAINSQLEIKEEELEMFKILYATKYLSSKKMVDFSKGDRTAGSMKNRITTFKERGIIQSIGMSRHSNENYYILTNPVVDVFNKLYGNEFLPRKDYSTRNYEHQTYLGDVIFNINSVQKIDMFLSDILSEYTWSNKALKISPDSILISITPEGYIDIYYIEAERTQSEKGKFIKKMEKYAEYGESLINYNYHLRPLIIKFLEKLSNNNDFEAENIKKLRIRNFKVLFIMENDGMLESYKTTLKNTSNEKTQSVFVLFTTIDKLENIKKHENIWDSILNENLKLNAQPSEVLKM